ncbi:MAG: cobalamin-binding protein [Thaumarchaeota archaeon]|jgi:corrinoid protein of di/trimethylamine methyltransferase|nr:cobalamin-binding protein [Nitrososphaerota archaeon]
MSKENLLDAIRDSIVNLDFDKSREYTLKALESGVKPQEIISKSIAEGMDIVGKKFEASEYFLSELIVAGEIGKEITKILEPHLKGTEVKKLGKVVIGTVRGDLHDIGKNIVAIMLEAAGFEVVDLGADVPPEKFVEAVKKENPDIVAMSALLTVTMVEMKNVIEALKEAGLRSKVKVIVGGAPVTEEFAKSIGADGYGADAVQGVRICKAWMEEKNKAKN